MAEVKKVKTPKDFASQSLFILVVLVSVLTVYVVYQSIS